VPGRPSNESLLWRLLRHALIRGIQDEWQPLRPEPIITNLALGDPATFSVASSPFHSMVLSLRHLLQQYYPLVESQARECAAKSHGRCPEHDACKVLVAEKDEAQAGEARKRNA
jgi:hypothetical protein